MAIVYAAHDLRHQRLVALKVLHPEMDSRVNVRRFEREIRILASLQHPNILPLHDSGRAGSLPYYVAPLVSRGSLRQRLDADRALPVDSAVRIAIDVCEALNYAHQQGFVHRDIKPANILLSGGRAILADFGVALRKSVGEHDQNTDTDLGSPGTPLYMSPEQPLGRSSLDGRTDIYSLGLVLFEMLAGELPFGPATGPSAWAWRYAAEEPTLHGLPHEVPVPVVHAIVRALRRDPASRFETSGEFASALTAAAVRAA